MSASGPTRLRNARRGRPSSRVGGRTDPALALLRQAEFWVDATRSPVVGGKLKNLGSGGSALDATFGSTAPSAYFNGTALVLPGVNGNYASIPDSAALDITSVVEFVVHVACNDWTPAGIQSILNKYTGVPGGGGYEMQINTDGTIRLVWDNGTAVIALTSTTPVGAADGSARWLKATLDTVSAAPNATLNFYTAASQTAEPTTWTQLGSTVVGGTPVVPIAANTSDLFIGTRSPTVNPFAGSIYRTIVRNGIGGTTVFDADFAKPFDTTSFTATTGQTVTLNRSTSGVDTNDPTLLTHEGTNYLYCPGAVGNTAAVSDTPELGLVNANAEWVVRFRANSLANGPLLTSKPYGGTGHWVQLNTNGSITLGYLEASAPTTIRAGASAAGAYVVGTDAWIKVRRNYLTGLIEFYTAPNQPTEPTVWTAVGTASPAAGSFIDNANNFNMGGDSTTANLDGRLYRVIVRNTTLDTTVLDVDFTTGITSSGQTSFTCTTGQTVFLQRSLGGRKTVAVTRPVVLLGTDDYLEVPDNALLDFAAGESFTVLAVARVFATPLTNGRLLQKGAATDPRWFLFCSNTVASGFQISDNTTTATPSTSNGSVGALNVFAGVVDRTAQVVRAYINGTVSTDSSTGLIGSLENAGVMRIGAVPVTTTNPFDGEIVAAAVFRRTLTAAEINNIASYYGAA